MTNIDFSVAILSLDGSHKPLNCNFPHETLIVRTLGWGKARCEVMAYAKNSLVIMVNGDVEVKAELWHLLLSCKLGDFYMTKHGEGACSRIFAINHEDYFKVGFDSSIKHIFEDGDFYVRALSKGLNCKIIPAKFYVHNPHFHEIDWFTDWEYSRMFVKYKYYVRRSLLQFFIQPWSLKRLPHMLLRVFAVEFWFVRGCFFEGCFSFI